MAEKRNYDMDIEQVSILIFQVRWKQFVIDLLDVKEIIQAG